MEQLAMEFTGEMLKQHGIMMAIEHADAKHPDWYKRACRIAHNYIKSQPKGHRFMLEEIRNWSEENNLIETPPSKRAWGAVSRFIVKEGLARISGYASVSNPLAHRTPASLYIKN